MARGGLVQRGERQAAVPVGETLQAGRVACGGACWRPQVDWLGALRMTWQDAGIARDPGCAVCGEGVARPGRE
jgi:hypothetical protein